MNLINSSKNVQALITQLFPIFRSITGDGLRKTIKILKKVIPLETIEFKSNLKVNDWRIPKEWIINDAYIITPDGKKICDIKKNNLHLVNYSVPVKKKLNRKDLDKFLYSIESNPNKIPYITSYYKKRWGFCISHNERKSLKDGQYSVLIDSKFVHGSLTAGHYLLKGKSKYEIIFSTYICHPSMANDQLSGPLTLAILFQLLKKKKRHFSYRFIFAPETIGSIAYLSQMHKSINKNVLGGYVVSLTGGKGNIVYRKAKNCSSLSNLLAIRSLKKNGKYKIMKFNPSKGNDQRQFCSPGYDYDIGCITNTNEQKNSNYHNSGDNLDSLNIKNIFKISKFCEVIVNNLESIDIYENLKNKGEPFLTRYKLYSDLGDSSKFKSNTKLTKAIMWILNYSDKKHDLIEIQKKSQLDLTTLKNAAKICERKQLIKKI